MVKVLWFLLFLFAYAIFLALSGLISKPDTIKTRTASFLYLEASSLLSAAVLYVFVLILTRFSNILIPGIYLLGCQVYILVGIALGIVRVRRGFGRYRAETIWASTCFRIRNAWIIIAIVIVESLVGVIGYPVVAGIIFFSGDSSASVTLGIIRITLLILFVGGLVIATPDQMGAALSANVSRATRRRFFVYSAVSILPTGVLLAMLLWTFSASVSKTAHATVSFRLTYTPLEMSILVAYFVIGFLLPYVIGTARIAGQQNELLKRKTDLLSKALDILEIPMSDYYGPALADLLNEVETQFDTFVRSDKSILFGLSFDESLAQGQRLNQSPASELPTAGQNGTGGHDPVPESAAVPTSAAAPAPAAARTATALAPEEERQTRSTVDVMREDPVYASVYKVFDPVNYRLARADDLRFQYIDWLNKLYGRLQATTTDLQHKRTDTTRVNAARLWVDSYKQLQADLDRPATGTKINAGAALVVTTIITSLLTVFVTGFGNWLWTQVAHALPK